MSNLPSALVFECVSVLVDFGRLLALPGIRVM